MLLKFPRDGGGGGFAARRCCCSRLRQQQRRRLQQPSSSVAQPSTAAPASVSLPRWLEGRRVDDDGSFSSRRYFSSSTGDERQSNKLLYPHLFKPLRLRRENVVLSNRVLMGSMHTGLEGLSIPRFVLPFVDGKSGHDHLSLDKLAAYFRERAEGGVGLMVTGGISPNRQGWTGPFSSQLTNQREADLHRVVTRAVRDVRLPVARASSGSHVEDDDSLPITVPSRICLQILHTGRYAYHPWAVSSSTTKSPISPFKARGLSRGGIRRTKDDFLRTAVLAREAGYDGVEIMGSEGYLLSQFLAPRTNTRNDEYGGPKLENRVRLPLEIVRETRAAVGDDFIVIFRLSLLDLVEGGLSFDESVQIAKWLEDAGVSIINTGIGWHEARVPTIATSVPRAAFAFPTERLAALKAVSIPLIATNRINDPDVAETLLRNNSETDLMVSMARPFLADPEFVNKAREGRKNEINTCIACNQACLDHVFVGKVASCLVNPRACHETELPKPSPDNVDAPLNVAVIGAGPAGCAFAITAAQNGHNVTLYDKDDRLGGQFNMAKRIPGKEEFHETLRYFETMLNKHKVNIRLGTEITFDKMESMNDVDKWIVATGVDPRDPKIPGQDHPNVLSYVDVLKRKKPVGKRVAVIGAGGIGFDVSEYLIHYTGEDKIADEVSKEEFWHEWGIDSTLKERGGLAPPDRHSDPDRRQLYLLQRKKSKLGAGLGKTTGWIHRATLNNSGAVEMISGVKYDEVDEKGHLHITVTDKKGRSEKRVLEVDNIVVCAGQVEYDKLQVEATKSAALKEKVYTIGGAYMAGELDAKRAIDMGTRLALRIHDPAVTPGKHVMSSEPGIEESMFQLLKRFM